MKSNKFKRTINMSYKGSSEDKRRAIRYIQRVKSLSRCIKCGESRPWCLHFHHRNKKDKVMSINTMARNGFPIEIIKKEIRKCDCLCANDHMEIHYRRYWMKQL